MLNKLFGSRKRKPPFGSLVPPNPVHPRTPLEEKLSSALKIIHACHYMAVPAARIMEKYPSFILARPEIFRRPWDSVVQPDEILVRGRSSSLFRSIQRSSSGGELGNLSRTSLPIPFSESSISYASAKQQDELTSKSFLLGGDVGKSVIRTLKSKGKTKLEIIV